MSLLKYLSVWNYRATASPYYQAYTSHYPQAAYATHYQTYAPPATQSTTQTPARPATTTGQYQTSTYNLGTTTTPATAASTTAASGAGGMDTADIATLNDALGSAGVDLRVCSRPSDAFVSLFTYELPI